MKKKVLKKKLLKVHENALLDYVKTADNNNSTRFKSANNLVLIVFIYLFFKYILCLLFSLFISFKKNVSQIL